jgi:hypothetical protein
LAVLFFALVFGFAALAPAAAFFLPLVGCLSRALSQEKILGASSAWHLELT